MLPKNVDLVFKLPRVSLTRNWDGKKVDVAGFEGETIINTADFGMAKPGEGNDVKIEFTLEAAQDKN